MGGILKSVITLSYVPHCRFILREYLQYEVCILEKKYRSIIYEKAIENSDRAQYQDISRIVEKDCHLKDFLVSP